MRISHALIAAAMLSLPAISAMATFSVFLISWTVDCGSIQSGKSTMRSGLLAKIVSKRLSISITVSKACNYRDSRADQPGYP